MHGSASKTAVVSLVKPSPMKRRRHNLIAANATDYVHLSAKL
jgi:hypothetical protein